MFTLKVFHPDGSYWAISCPEFRVIPATLGCVKQVEAGRSLIQFDGSVEKVIVENETGKTIDIIRAQARV